MRKALTTPYRPMVLAAPDTQVKDPGLHARPNMNVVHAATVVLIGSATSLSYPGCAYGSVEMERKGEWCFLREG